MTSPALPEPAVAAGEDPRRYAKLLSAVHDAAMTGGKGPARPREVIAESWNRLMAKGADPDADQRPVVDTADLDEMRQGSGLAMVVDEVARGLDSVICDGHNILVIADERGRVLWRSGSPGVLRNADRLGFVEGAHWSENSVGTNAIGTALASHRTVQIFSAEHFLRTHHAWTCAGAPIRDPRTGQVIGVVDVSGPAITVHPTTVALVDTVARLAESRIRELHHQSLSALCMVAAPMLAGCATPALAVDRFGWVAAVSAASPRNRVSLPPDIAPRPLWIPSLGMCDVEPLSGGWLLRVTEDSGPTIATATLDLRDEASASLTVVGHSGHWRQDLSLRHAEILYVLATHREGRSAPELADDLYGDRSRTVTVRAEISRLRRHFAGLVLAQPYRFPESAEVTVLTPDHRAALLPGSTAPAIRQP